MHQHPRPPPVTASPATSQRTNPQQTNNPREPDRIPSRASFDTPSPVDAVSSEADTGESISRPQRPAGDGREPIAKLNQVIQNFYTKAALLIISHRAILSPAMSKETGEKRVNKWFNVEVDETNDLLDALRLWKTSHIKDQRPAPMIIEIYIEIGGSGQQSLILQDEIGHQWGVEDAIKSYIETNGSGESMPEAPCIILERWRCQLGRQTRDLPSDLTSILPKVYKNSIMLFRSLFAYLKLLPTWELTKKRHLKASQRSPKLRYRIYEEGRRPDVQSSAFDELELALDDGRSPVTETYGFDPIESPAGPYTVEVTFRRRCDFRLEKSMESVYSSRFIGQDDDDLFRPSLDRYNSSQFRQPVGATGREDVGSAPHRRPNLMELAAQTQAYGSMSTYHNTNARLGSSPMSALRAARELNMRSPTDDTFPGKSLPDDRAGTERPTPLQSHDATPTAPRRTSVSVMPGGFKTHSLSASPLQAEVLAAAPHRQPIGRQSALAALADARRPSNAASLAPHGSPVPPTEAAYSLSSSPRPTSGRYSSSFGHRRARPSLGGGSKTEDDQTSSGKASLSSSTQQPSSTVMGGQNNSSGSLHTDDDNISDFLKMLDQTRELKSFQSPPEASMEASRRNITGLSKYQRLRDTNSALTESLSTSLQMQRSPSTGSSRQPSSTPPTAGNATSASPVPLVERMSPRTPHTPAVPSRLSANSIIDYTHGDAGIEQAHGTLSPGPDRARVIPSDTQHRSGSTVAIDIPSSLRFNPSYRRSSSAAHRGNRTLDYDDRDTLPFAMRSASMGTRDERQPVPMNELLQEGSSGRATAVARVAQSHLSGGEDMARQRSNESQKSNEDESPESPRFRPRVRGDSRRGVQDSGSSYAAGSGSASSEVRGSRYTFARPGTNFDDEEPLLFAMSDFTSAQAGRRSLEDAQNKTGSTAVGREAGNSPTKPSDRRSSRQWS